MVTAILLILFLFRPGVRHLRYRIAGSISSALGRRVTLDNVRIHVLPRPGFDLEGLVMHDDPAFSAEPIVRAHDVSAAIRLSSLLRGRLEIATLSAPIAQLQEFLNPNVVKVVVRRDGSALYFSRATIPWARDAFAAARAAIPLGLPLYRHYGLYAYRVNFLRLFPTLPPSPIERFEALEQLRALWHGYRIVVEITEGTPAPGVDSEDDLAQVRAIYARGGA